MSKSQCHRELVLALSPLNSNLKVFVEYANGMFVNCNTRGVALRSVLDFQPVGLLLSVVVHPADVQDRAGAFHLPCRARRLLPFIEHIFADGGCAGRKMALTVWRTGIWRMQVVKRSNAARFAVRCPAQTVDR